MTERYLDRFQVREWLAERGVELDDRQVRRALEPDASGKRKIPARKCPLRGCLIVAESDLENLYPSRHMARHNSPQNSPQGGTGRNGQARVSAGSRGRPPRQISA